MIDDPLNERSIKSHCVPRPKRHYRNMTPAKAVQARDMYFKQRMTQKAIADVLGIKQNTVSRIISEMVWNNE